MRVVWVFFLLCAANLFAENSLAKNIPASQKKNAENVLTLLDRTLVDVPIEQCERRGICDLKRLLFVVEDYKLMVGKGDYQHFTLMYATYETSSFETLENYAFVQFIRGSAFTSQKNLTTGKVEVTYDGALANFNQWIVYRIPTWIIDSKEANPVYMSKEGLARHYWYRWQKNILPAPWITQEENIYKNRKEGMSAPRLYVDDDPQAAFMSKGVAYNVSLEFKTCLYKSREIPVKTTRDNLDFAEPIYCFPWRSSYVYDHYLQKFESPAGLVFPQFTGPNELQILGDRPEKIKSEQEQ